MDMWHGLAVWRYPQVTIEELLGKVCIDIEVMRDGDDDYILFTCLDDSQYLMCHDDDCCEDVRIEDINGDVKCLLDRPITLARETTKDVDKDPEGRPVDSATWTFYSLSAGKGYVDIRWFGESNGWYSESVDLYCVKEVGEVIDHDRLS